MLLLDSSHLRDDANGLPDVSAGGGKIKKFTDALRKQRLQAFDTPVPYICINENVHIGLYCQHRCLFP